MSEQATEALELSASIKPMLAGHDPGDQGAALADLVSFYIAGHHPMLRDEVLAVFVDGVREMVPVSAQELFGPAGWPS